VATVGDSRSDAFDLLKRALDSARVHPARQRVVDLFVAPLRFVVELAQRIDDVQYR
jgi:hypothetical protein